MKDLSKGADGFLLTKGLLLKSGGFCRDNRLHLGNRKISLVNLGNMYEQGLTLMKIFEVQCTKSKVQLRWVLVPTCSQGIPTAPLLPVRNRAGLGWTAIAWQCLSKKIKTATGSKRGLQVLVHL